VGAMSESRTEKDFEVKGEQDYETRKERWLWCSNVAGEARKELCACGVERKARASRRAGSSKLTYDERKLSKFYLGRKWRSIFMRCIVVHHRPFQYS
jgi:hypothetical protein